ncbi:hypothetical protein C9975_01765 [Thalassospira xiamenensis]|nr:hypothetical protein C9939_02925 [Pseudidiomarina aestuarii]PTC01519.1 hypothetical protein C9975_01765 [Thalassospira xiamenensis]
MIKKPVKFAKKCIDKLVDDYKYPYRRINSLPSERPSVQSVYYFINQLGKHQPVGLTHDVGTGYHELPFPELKFKTSRSDLDGRLHRIKDAQRLKGAYGIDVGCAIGGMTFGLQKLGAQMVGIDRDQPSINVASECEALFQTGANFECRSVDEGVVNKLSATYGNPQTGRFDFAVWFSSFNWVAEALGKNATIKVLKEVSASVDTLIADSAIGGKGASALEDIGIVSNETFVSFVLEHSSYSNFEVVGQDSNWYGREVYKFF